jgi:hypothetical protein
MTDTTNDNTVTLKSICASLKIDPYDARGEAAQRTQRRQAIPPHLAKHKAGHAWAWPKNSPAIKEVKAALKNGDAS